MPKIGGRHPRVGGSGQYFRLAEIRAASGRPEASAGPLVGLVVLDPPTHAGALLDLVD